MNGSLWRKYGGLFLLALITLCAFNWNLPVTDPVESNYALTAKEMVLAGNWISPQIYGHYWFDKPIFAYWLLEISYKLFGFGDFASRLPGAVMGAATVLAAQRRVLVQRFVFADDVCVLGAQPRRGHGSGVAFMDGGDDVRRVSRFDGKFASLHDARVRGRGVGRTHQRAGGTCAAGLDFIGLARRDARRAPLETPV